MLNKNVVRFINRPAAVMRLPCPATAGPTIAVPELPEQQQEEEEAAATQMIEVDMAPQEVNYPQAPIAQLSKCPRNLHDLWREYEFGFAGYKAAKDFTSRERGAYKYKYYRRNVFWSKVNEHVLTSHSADEACDLIYRAYGQSSSVTIILRGIIRDKKTGGHASLR